MTRVLGVSLAVNGVTEGKALEQPGKLPRTLAFANSILTLKVVCGSAHGKRGSQVYNPTDAGRTGDESRRPAP